jgi:DNA ligase 1
MKEYDSEDKAKKEYDKLIAEKTKKGYALAGSAAPAAKPAAPAAKPEPAKRAAATKSAAVFDDEGDDEEDETPKPKKAAATPAAPVKAATTPAANTASSKSTEEGARYFEFVDGASSKFWEIKLEGTAFTTRYGKIGTDGQTSMKEYDSDDKAQKEYDKLVAEKTKKGYAEK